MRKMTKENEEEWKKIEVERYIAAKLKTWPIILVWLLHLENNSDLVFCT